MTTPSATPLDERIQRAIESENNIGIYPRKIVSLLPNEWQAIISALQRQREQPVGEVAELVKELNGPYSTLARSLAHRAASTLESLSAQVAELTRTLAEDRQHCAIIYMTNHKCYDRHPFIWNLWDMLRFYADKFYSLMSLMDGVATTIAKHPLKDIPKEIKVELANRVVKLGEIAKAVGLGLSVKTIGEMEEILRRGDELSGGQFAKLVEELSKRVRQELEDTFVFSLPKSGGEYYEPPEPLFGQEVHDNFASSRDDISEAGKCFALARYTATVMHLMRALEIPLTAMAAEFSVTLKRDNWGEAIGLIEKAILALDPKTDADKKDFFSAAAVQFRYFKDAWRNHSMHARGKYVEEEADIIFRAVKSFMRQLAKRIKE